MKTMIVALAFSAFSSTAFARTGAEFEITYKPMNSSVVCSVRASSVQVHVGILDKRDENFTPMAKIGSAVTSALPSFLCEAQNAANPGEIRTKCVTIVSSDSERKSAVCDAIRVCYQRVVDMFMQSTDEEATSDIVDGYVHHMSRNRAMGEVQFVLHENGCL